MIMSCYRRNCSLVVVFILLSIPLAAQEPLTLAEAVARALESNPDLAIDAAGQQAAHSEFEAARAGYLPRLNFEQSYLAGNNPVFVFGTLLTQRRFTEENFALPALNNPSPVNNLLTRFTLQQTIWDFGRTPDQRSRARLGIEIADQSHEAHVCQVLLEVFNSYYSISLARDSLETARIALRSAEAIELQAKARVDSGLAVEADLLRSRAYLSTVRQQEIQAQGRLESAQMQLNRLMGNPLKTPMGTTAPLEAGDLNLPAEESLLAEQKQRRPDYQSLLAELREAEFAAKSRKNQYWPVLAGYGAWEMDNPSFSEYGGNNWAAGVTLSWNLLSSVSDSPQVEAARHRLEQKRRQVAAMESAMALEVHRALIEYRAAQQLVLAAQAAESQSEEGLRILRNRYDAGLATMTDLLSAETARSNARTNLSEAIYRHRLSFAQVEYTAGILSPTSPAMNLQ
jgi:outer membrane protein